MTIIAFKDEISNLPNVEINHHYLDRYVALISSLGLCLSKDEYTEGHHILPESLFPQYANPSGNPWNILRMSAKAHFIAHWLLWKAMPNNSKMSMAFWAMSTMVDADGRDYKIPSRIYQKLREERATRVSELNSGFTVYENDKGDTFRLRVDDPIIKEMNLFGVAKRCSQNTATYTNGVINKRLKTDDPLVISGEFTHISFGRVPGEYERSEASRRLLGKSTYVNSLGIKRKLTKEESSSGDWVQVSNKNKSPYNDGTREWLLSVDDPKITEFSLVKGSLRNVSNEKHRDKVTVFDITKSGWVQIHKLEYQSKRDIYFTTGSKKVKDLKLLGVI